MGKVVKSNDSWCRITFNKRCKTSFFFISSFIHSFTRFKGLKSWIYPFLFSNFTLIYSILFKHYNIIDRNKSTKFESKWEQIDHFLGNSRIRKMGIRTIFRFLWAGRECNLISLCLGFASTALRQLIPLLLTDFPFLCYFLRILPPPRWCTHLKIYSTSTSSTIGDISDDLASFVSML